MRLIVPDDCHCCIREIAAGARKDNQKENKVRRSREPKSAVFVGMRSVGTAP